MEDLQLLREYAETRSEAAFAELVQRHVDLVYSTALRLVGEASLAQDVTQLVFIRLARKAGSLRDGTILSGWLYRTTRFVAETVRRSDWRRRQRETLAMQLNELDRNSESVWKEVSPLLEQAMAGLRQKDQDAVLLRFFGGKSLREVGDALGISDDAAQKRVDRALDRMRDYFSRRGVVVSAALLAPALAGHAVNAAPVSVAATLAASAAGASGTSLGVGSFNLLKVMALAKLKTSVAGIVAAVLVLGGTVAVVQLLPDATTHAQPAAPANSLSNAAFVVRGTVHATNGRPLAGALVRLATPDAYVRLYQTTNAVATAQTNRTNGISNRAASPWDKPAPSVITGADGSFAFGLPTVPREGKAVVAVNADSGYAIATADDLSANPVMVVQAWGRIEGVLKEGKSIGSNQMVNIGIWGTTETYEWNIVSHDMSVKTDMNGRFIFPRVAPGDAWLTHTVAVRPGDGRQSGHHYVKVEPGDHLEVILGGMGRLVTGRIETNPGTNLVFYGSMWANETHGMRNARNWRTMSNEEKRLFIRQWRNSPQSEIFKEEVRNYEFPVQRDGTFRVPDVLPARYRMQVRADAPREPGKPARHAAVAEITVIVPELSAGEPDEPFNVGTLRPVPK